MIPLSRATLAAALVVPTFGIPPAVASPAVAVDTPMRGRIIAQSVTEPWMQGPVETQRRWGDGLFLATSRPCVGDRRYAGVRVIRAKADNPALQYYADVWTQDYWQRQLNWTAAPHNVKELSNIAAVQMNLGWNSHLPPAVAGAYTFEISCVAVDGGQLLATFVGDVRVAERSMVDVSEALPIARRAVRVRTVQNYDRPNAAEANVTSTRLAPPFDIYSGGIDLTMKAGGVTLSEHREGALPGPSRPQLYAPGSLPASAENAVQVTVSPTTLQNARKPLFKEHTETHRVKPRETQEGPSCRANPKFDTFRADDGRLSLRLLSVADGWAGTVSGVVNALTGNTENVNLNATSALPLTVGAVAAGQSLTLALKFSQSEQSECASNHTITLSDGDNRQDAHVQTLKAPVITGYRTAGHALGDPPEFDVVVWQEIPAGASAGSCSLTFPHQGNQTRTGVSNGRCFMAFRVEAWNVPTGPAPLAVSRWGPPDTRFFGAVQSVDLHALFP